MPSPRPPDGPSTSPVHLRTRRGFTLVELLVVIGVIAVLVGMLLPALNAAREQARLVDDLTRIRQLAIAANMYAADYGGSVPPLVASVSGMPWQGYAIWHPSGYAVSLADPALPHTAGWPDLLQMYLDPQNQRDKPTFKEYSGVMYCSADSDGHEMTGMSPGYTYFTMGWWGNLYFREPSYRMNPYVTGVKPTGLAYPNGAPIYGTKFANVRNAGRKVFFVESHYESVNGAHWGSMMAVAPFINGQILSNK